jgi:hypothetical protein
MSFGAQEQVRQEWKIDGNIAAGINCYWTTKKLHQLHSGVLEMN